MSTSVTEAKKEETKLCPDAKYCINSRSGCSLSSDCWPKARNEPQSVFFATMLSRIKEGKSINFQESFFLFNKELFLTSGGDEKTIDSILDDVVNSYYLRRKTNGEAPM